MDRPSRAFGEIRLASSVAGSPFDALAHAADLAAAVGHEVRLPEELTAQMLAWAGPTRAGCGVRAVWGPSVRSPGTSIQDRFLAFTGR